MKKALSCLLALCWGIGAMAQSQGTYDFVVPRDGSFREALAAANDRPDTTSRFRIFVMQGTYQIPTEGTTVGGDSIQYGDPRCWLKVPNTSIIGEDRDKTIIINTVPEPCWNNGFGKANPLEGIGKGDVLIVEKKAHHTYLQDITLRSGMADNTGRNIAFNDRSGGFTIAKNVCLWAYQDTYVSANNRALNYFEGGIIRGRTDYICGKGDVLYDRVTFQQCGKGGYLAVPSTPVKYGYVMLNCYIHSETDSVTYYLGRPWGKGTPRAIWINTVVDNEPITRDKKGYNGWADMSGGWPALFTEYNTTFKATGQKLNTEGRRTIYTDREGIQHSNAPVLSEQDASIYTMQNVLAGWDPTLDTKPAEVSDVKLSGNTLSWKGSDNALLYAVCRNGAVVGFTNQTTYKAKGKKGDKWSVRAANQMGGLSDAVEAK